MSSGHVPEGSGGVIGPRQEFVEAAVGVSVDDLCDDFREVRARIDPCEFARLDQRGDDGPMLGTAVRACEQCILAIKGDRSDCSLDNIGIDFDAAVVDKVA
jgi:hypothetical protein